MAETFTLVELAQAMRNNEFLMYYQPFMDTNSGEVAGMESFVRWQHPKLGLREAGEFIQVIRQDALFSQAVDAWVLRQTLKQAVVWKQLGYVFGAMTVHISSWHQGIGLLPLVEEALNETTAPHRLLSLEAHNDMLAEVNSPDVMKTIVALAKKNVGFSIDHFSLIPSDVETTLHLPVREVKIDAKTLVAARLSALEDAARKSIRALKKRHIKVIGIGVETEEQRQNFHDLGVQFFQGSLYKSPLGAKHISSMLYLIKKTEESFGC